MIKKRFIKEVIGGLLTPSWNQKSLHFDISKGNSLSILYQSRGGSLYQQVYVLKLSEAIALFITYVKWPTTAGRGGNERKEGVDVRAEQHVESWFLVCAFHFSQFLLTHNHTCGCIKPPWPEHCTPCFGRSGLRSTTADRERKPVNLKGVTILLSLSFCHESRINSNCDNSCFLNTRSSLKKKNSAPSFWANTHTFLPWWVDGILFHHRLWTGNVSSSTGRGGGPLEAQEQREKERKLTAREHLSEESMRVF